MCLGGCFCAYFDFICRRSMSTDDVDLASAASGDFEAQDDETEKPAHVQQPERLTFTDSFALFRTLYLI
jgi:hypothetical protein